jgi:hypothetical protein
MVRPVTARCALLVTACVTLGACQFWQLALSSTFPAAVTQETARHDLTSLISAADASSFVMRDLPASGREYIILASPLTTDGVRLIIMDPDLNVLLTFTAQDLAGFGASLGTAPAKRSAAFGTIELAIGNLFFDFTAAGLVLPPFMRGVPPQGPGFELAVSGNFNFQDFSCAGNFFTFVKYSDTWGPVSGGGTFPILASPGANTSFSVHAIFSDPDPARQYTLFVLFDADTGLDHYFTIPMSDLNSGTGGLLAFPLQSFYEVFTKPAADPNLLGYANGGFIRFVPSGTNARSGAFVRTDLNGTDHATQLHYFNLPDIRMAYSPSGTSYFVFDTGTRAVTRMAAWWN